MELRNSFLFLGVVVLLSGCANLQAWRERNFLSSETEGSQQRLNVAEADTQTVTGPIIRTEPTRLPEKKRENEDDVVGIDPSIGQADDLQPDSQVDSDDDPPKPTKTPVTGFKK